MKIVADPNIPFVREAFGSLGEIQLVPGRQMTAAHVRDSELLLVLADEGVLHLLVRAKYAAAFFRIAFSSA